MSVGKESVDFAIAQLDKYIKVADENKITGPPLDLLTRTRINLMEGKQNLDNSLFNKLIEVARSSTVVQYADYIEANSGFLLHRPSKQETHIDYFKKNTKLSVTDEMVNYMGLTLIVSHLVYVKKYITTPQKAAKS